MTADEVRAFAARDWGAVGDSDLAHWANEFAERGPAAAIAASRALWEHARRIHPEWPTDADTEQDLAQLLRLKALIERAAHAFAGR